MLAQVETENAQIVRDIFEHVSKNEINRVAELYTTGGTLLSIPLNITSRGPNAVLDFVRNLKTAFPDMKITVQQQVSQDEYVVTEATWRGTHRGALKTPTGDIPATNRSIDLPVCSIHQIRDGKIVSARQYFDLNTLLRQIGKTS